MPFQREIGTMSIDSSVAKKPFELNSCLSNLAHFLPAQAPLKDFIHHNTLHGFQKHVFFEGLALASRSLGFKVLLNLSEYRDKYHRGEINPEILVACIQEDYPKETPKVILDKLLNDKELPPLTPGKVGQLRTTWNTKHGLDMDERVHPTLFRLLCSYLDQGIAMWDFPSASEQGFLQSVRIISSNGIVGLFSSVRAQKMLLDESLSIESLLTLIVGPDKEFFEPYLIDQQFAHQGWSGLVSTLEANPSTMLKKRAISLHDLVLIELLFELDALETHLGNRWRPLSLDWGGPPPMIFDSSDNLETETFKALKVLHNAFEWTYYDQVLSALHSQHGYPETKENPGMQVLFCIDDRECSFRRHLESTAPDCVTFGTPGFFGVEFYFQPTGGKFYNKLCPAPVSPQYLIREHGKGSGHSKDLHVSKDSHGLGKGLLMTQTIGFWSAARLFLSIFRPRPSSATASSFQHMSPDSELSILCTDPTNRPEGLQ